MSEIKIAHIPKCPKCGNESLIRKRLKAAYDGDEPQDRLKCPDPRCQYETDLTYLIKENENENI